MKLDVRPLQYWHKLEHFYPYVLQEQKSQYIRTYLVGEQRQLPNFESPVTDEDKEVRGYCVYLGIFGVAPALTALEDGIGQKMRFKDCGKDESCFCMFRLSPDGIFLPESFQTSSFPWAIHRVRDGKIDIDQWDELSIPSSGRRSPIYTPGRRRWIMNFFCLSGKCLQNS